jgi:dTDP-4-amino-4,6-dideoxygalactose transaminase
MVAVDDGRGVMRLAPLLSTTLDQRAMEIARVAAAMIREGSARDTSSEGAATRAWEQRFATWLNGGYVRAFGSGRAALFAVTKALGLGPGDGVIVPAFTCQSVLNALRYTGAEPQYADIETDAYGLDIDAVNAAMGPRTRAVLLQHTFGLIGRDIEPLLTLAKERQLLVIEDCAHALGATWQGKKLGRLGDGAIFSFERGKVLSTVHGGMAVVHSPEAAARLEGWADETPLPDQEQLGMQMNSVVHDYWTQVASDSSMAGWARRRLASKLIPRMWPEEFDGRYCSHYRERMADVVAALAQSQFDRLDEVLSRRRAQAAAWQIWANASGALTAKVTAGSEPAWLRFPIWVDARTKAEPGALERELGVELGLWFTSPAHPVPSPQAHCPRGMDACAHVVNLPTLLPAGHPHGGV